MLQQQGQIVDLSAVAQAYGDLADIDEIAKIIRPMTQQEQQQAAQANQPPAKAPTDLIDYKDTTPFIQAQMEKAAGFQPDPSHTQGLAHPPLPGVPGGPPGVPSGQPQFHDATIAQAANDLMQRR